jgi:hypothetical protein
VCDPACGAGAFLLECVRQLAGRLLEHGLETDLNVAKRLVASHCVYGVDIGHWAVASAKVALWLECRAERMPPGWLDENIRVGDALVGLTNDPIARFHWSPSGKDKRGNPIPEAPEIRALVDRAMREAVEAREFLMSAYSEAARA